LGDDRRGLDDRERVAPALLTEQAPGLFDGVLGLGQGPEDLLQGADTDQAALGEHRHPVADPLDHVEQVRGVELRAILAGS
jgi:hypothetical protein